MTLSAQSDIRIRARPWSTRIAKALPTAAAGSSPSATSTPRRRVPRGSRWSANQPDQDGGRDRSERETDLEKPHRSRPRADARLERWRWERAPRDWVRPVHCVRSSRACPLTRPPVASALAW